MNCPQCGEETTEFFEGVCVWCCRENQDRLTQHSAEFDAWQKLTPEQREIAIKNAP